MKVQMMRMRRKQEAAEAEEAETQPCTNYPYRAWRSASATCARQSLALLALTLLSPLLFLSHLVLGFAGECTASRLDHCAGPRVGESRHLSHRPPQRASSTPSRRPWRDPSQQLAARGRHTSQHPQADELPPPSRPSRAFSCGPCRRTASERSTQPPPTQIAGGAPNTPASNTRPPLFASACPPRLDRTSTKSHPTLLLTRHLTPSSHIRSPVAFSPSSNPRRCSYPPGSASAARARQPWKRSPPYFETAAG